MLSSVGPQKPGPLDVAGSSGSIASCSGSGSIASCIGSAGTVMVSLTELSRSDFQCHILRQEPCLYTFGARRMIVVLVEAKISNFPPGFRGVGWRQAWHIPTLTCDVCTGETGTPRAVAMTCAGGRGIFGLAASVSRKNYRQGKRKVIADLYELGTLR